MGKSTYLTERKKLVKGLKNLLKTSPSKLALYAVKDKLRQLMKTHGKHKERTFESNWSGHV